jgi:hypothetical protein
MQNILPVLCFIAGFALAWLVLRWRKRETETAFRALSADALARNNQAFLDLANPTLAQTQQAAARRSGPAPAGHRRHGDARARVARQGGFGKIQELEKARAGAYAALQRAGARACSRPSSNFALKPANW